MTISLPNFRAVLLAGQLLVGVSAGGSDDVDREAQRIQQECMRYREAHFKHGSALISVREVSDDGAGMPRVGGAVRRRVWFSGNSLRNEGDAAPGIPGFAGIVCDQYYIDAATPAASVIIAPCAEYGGAQGALKNLGLVHPRWIGMSFNTNAALHGHNTAPVLRMGAEGVSIPRPAVLTEVLNGIETHKIEYHYSGVTHARMRADENPEEVRYEVRRSFWIAPSQGYGLLRAEEETVYPDKGEQIVSTINASFATSSEGVYFPKSTTTLVRHGGKIVSGNEVTIEDASFSLPSAKEFAIEALPMEANRRILDRTKGAYQEQFYWDGAKPVRIPRAGELVEIPVPANTSARRWLLVANGIILGAVALWLLCTRRRRAAAPNNHGDEQRDE